MNRNEIFISKKSKVLIPESKGKITKNVIASMKINIEKLGYTLSKDLETALAKIKKDDLVCFYNELVTTIKDITGAKNNFQPMYPNFPEQVMSMDEYELYTNAIIHYVGDILGVRLMPKYDKIERIELKGNYKLKVLELGTKSEYENIFKDMMASNVAWSITDKVYISTNNNIVINNLPENIPNKENLSFLIGNCCKSFEETIELAAKYIKTATDVLRLATSMSGGDVSLADVTMFKNFTRKERKMLAYLLDNVNNSNLAEEMLKHKNKWIRLGEKIHIGDYGKKYNKAYEAFQILRNNVKIKTFNNTIEKGLVEKDMKTLLEHIVKKPGEFARRLDHMIRISNNRTADNILTAFEKVSDKIATNVLLQVYNHFKNRNTNDYRVFLPKGNIGKCQIVENKSVRILSNICDVIVEMCGKTLLHRFSKLESLGKIYIDPRLKDFPVPFALRSASKALKTVTRGSKFPIESDKNFIRLFIWWKDMENDGGRVDIDLSASMYNDKWSTIGNVTFYNLKEKKFNACHSGDITSAPNGACEFIDIDIDSFAKNGGRYITMCVKLFTNQTFASLPECYAGWMTREDLKSGEIFDPKTITNKIDLTSDSTIAIPVVFDTIERKFIWADMVVKENSRTSNTLYGNRNGIEKMGMAITGMKKCNLYDLFIMHSSRGILVDTKEKADTIFSLEDGITPYDIDTITSKYLA